MLRFKLPNGPQEKYRTAGADLQSRAAEGEMTFDPTGTEDVQIISCARHDFCGGARVGERRAEGSLSVCRGCGYLCKNKRWRFLAKNVCHEGVG